MHHLCAVVGRFLACLLLIVTGVGAAGYLQLLLPGSSPERCQQWRKEGRKEGKREEKEEARRDRKRAALAGCCSFLLVSSLASIGE